MYDRICVGRAEGVPARSTRLESQRLLGALQASGSGTARRFDVHRTGNAVGRIERRCRQYRPEKHKSSCAGRGALQSAFACGSSIIPRRQCGAKFSASCGPASFPSLRPPRVYNGAGRSHHYPRSAHVYSEGSASLGRACRGRDRSAQQDPRAREGTSPSDQSTIVLLH
jgi:hypothetical protein